MTIAALGVSVDYQVADAVSNAVKRASTTLGDTTIYSLVCV